MRRIQPRRRNGVPGRELYEHEGPEVGKSVMCSRNCADSVGCGERAQARERSSQGQLLTDHLMSHNFILNAVEGPQQGVHSAI